MRVGYDTVKSNQPSYLTWYELLSSFFYFQSEDNPGTVSDTANFPSDSESEGQNSSGDEHRRNADDESSSDGDSEEIWNGVLPEMLTRDIENPPPLPKPQMPPTSLQKANSLIFWFVYFLLIWQATCHLSDNGLAWLLRFLVSWLKVLGIEVSNEVFEQLILTFPGSLYLVRKFLNVDRDDFTKFVVCPKCTKLYKYDSCLTMIGNRQVAKKCSNTYYLRGKSMTCNATMVTKVILQNGKACFYPIKYYCINSIIDELEKFLLRKNFATSCELWRNRNVAEDMLADVYDGNLWKEFQNVNGTAFLERPRNYGFMLNFDFFQPMKHRKDYSLGVFYLATLNLPRSERFKWENIIVIGIVPSLDREPKNLNEFLEPAVDELKALWKGVRLRSSLSRFALTVRAAVLCVSSDIPATRKICGFKGHSAVFGCSRCLKEFPGSFGEKRDYSGFDRNLWKSRTNQDHRRAALKISKCKTKTGRDLLGQKSGITHFSVLLKLEYFDVIRFCTVDPMHNLFLGTAKKMFKIWTDLKLFTPSQLKEIEDRIQSIEVPSDIGRLPMRITSNSGSYTAEQWKNWTLIYSVYCLKGILPEAHFRCWQTFVLACKYFCQSVISKTDLDIADGLILKFCKSVETLYGNEAVTPNMHLHNHLKAVILDHGPVTSFWCFSFERFNGILGSTSTNKRSVELQLMRKLLISRYLEDMTLPEQFQGDFLDLCSTNMESNDSVKESPPSNWTMVQEFNQLATTVPLHGLNWRNASGIGEPSCYKLVHFDNDDLQLLRAVYQLMYPDIEIEMKDLGECMHKLGSIKIGSITYGSKMQPRAIRSGKILASWPAGNGQILDETFSLAAGTVQYFFSHSIKLADEHFTHYFACVRWYVPDEESNNYGNPIKVFKHQLHPGGPSSFMPVQRIFSRYASVELEKEGQKNIVVSPITRNVHL